MLTPRGLVIAALPLLCLLVQAQARLHWEAREDEPDTIASDLAALPYDSPKSGGEITAARSLGEEEEAQDDADEPSAPASDGKEKPKETIAQVSCLSQ